MFNSRFLKIPRDSKYNFDKNKFLRLDANERIIPFSNIDFRLLKKCITNYSLQAYPTNRETVAKLIAKKEKISIDQVSITPGADSVLKYV